MNSVPDHVAGFPTNTVPQCDVTDVEVYRYKVSNLRQVDVQICVDYRCSFVAEFLYGPRRVQRAIDWVAENYPNRKVRVNV